MNLRILTKAVLVAALALILSNSGWSQSKVTAKKTAASARKPVAVMAKVTQIDIEGLKKLVKPNGKPLIINFWATWCDPCREEFPDLVKIDAAYKGKVDLITISLDDLAEINRDVPKFLANMKAQMPAYLLKTADEDAAMKVVTQDWAGNLPMTIIFSPNGDTAYLRKGKLHFNDVTAEIDKVLGIQKTAP